MTTSTAAPFPGLRPFARADATWFYGRTAQIAALRDRLDQHRFLAVVGGAEAGTVLSGGRAGLSLLLEAVEKPHESSTD